MHSVFWTLAKSQRAGFGGARSGGTPPWTTAEPGNDSTVAARADIAGHAYNAFIQESTLDEIAFAGGADPLELRRKLMSPYPAAIRRWIKRHGGLTDRPIYLRGRELAALYPLCR